jgi:hypothetical protein
MILSILIKSYTNTPRYKQYILFYYTCVTYGRAKVATMRRLLFYLIIIIAVELLKIRVLYIYIMTIIINQDTCILAG